MTNVTELSTKSGTRTNVTRRWKEGRPKIVNLIPKEHDEDPYGDNEQNALWDKLCQEHDLAQSWRDHDNLDAMLETIGRLRARIIIPAIPVESDTQTKY